MSFAARFTRTVIVSASVCRYFTNQLPADRATARFLRQVLRELHPHVHPLDLAQFFEKRLKALRVARVHQHRRPLRRPVADQPVEVVVFLVRQHRLHGVHPPGVVSLREVDPRRAQLLAQRQRRPGRHQQQRHRRENACHHSCHRSLPFHLSVRLHRRGRAAESSRTVRSYRSPFPVSRRISSSLLGVERRPVRAEDVVKPDLRLARVRLLPRVPRVDRVRLARDEAPVVRGDPLLLEPRQNRLKRAAARAGHVFGA